MNTADRSIALLDTALRRRFEFREIEPDYSVLVGAGTGQIPDDNDDQIDLRFVLMAINERLEFLRGRDQRIGHAYLSDVKTLEDLNRKFSRQIIPLLQEYFYEDWNGICRVLAVPKGVAAFVSKNSVSAVELFGLAVGEDLAEGDDQDHHVIANSFTGAMYRGLYQGREAAFQELLA